MSDLVSTIDSVDTSNLVYPCIEAIDCDSYITMFVQKRVCHSDSQIPVFSRGPRGILNIGKIDLNLDTLLSLSRFPMVRLVYHQSATESIELDLKDPYLIENFVRL